MDIEDIMSKTEADHIMYYFALLDEGDYGGAECYLGALYEDGIGVKQDYYKAIEHYKYGSQVNLKNLLKKLAFIIYLYAYYLISLIKIINCILNY